MRRFCKNFANKMEIGFTKKYYAKFVVLLKFNLLNHISWQIYASHTIIMLKIEKKIHLTGSGGRPPVIDVDARL